MRVAGDTYQWLYVWEGCVRAYKDSMEGVPGAVVRVGVEITAAGNMDDVVYYRADEEPTRYAQVKYAVDASTAVGEVRTRPIEELFGHRHHYAHTTSLEEAKHLVHAIAEQYPALRPAGTRLIQEALRYTAAVHEFYDRLMQQATLRRDFSMLLPEQYVTAALRSSADALARVFTATVFDPPHVQITTCQIFTAAADRQPPPPWRRLPRPPAQPPGPDPVETARAKAALAR